MAFDFLKKRHKFLTILLKIKPAKKIDELTEKLDIENTPPPGAPKIDFFEAASEKKALLEQMEGLIKKRDETQLQLDLINAYIDKATKKEKYGR